MNEVEGKCVTYTRVVRLGSAMARSAISIVLSGGPREEIATRFWGVGHLLEPF